MAIGTAAAQQSNRVLDEDEETRVKDETVKPPQTESDTLWKIGGNVGLNFSQSYFSNWAAGGQDAIGATGIVNVFANYRKEKTAWQNNLQLAYGLQRIGDNDFIKTDDKIDLTSKYSYIFDENWRASLLLNFRSQFRPGYEIIDNAENRDNKLSDFLAPGYVLLAPGLTYEPTDYFSAMLSPATSKVTIVRIDSLAPAYGVDEGENVRYEIGAYFRLNFNKELVKNVTYTTTLDLFSNYLENPQNIDVNWDNVLNFKVNEYINANLSWQLIYDDDVIISRSPQEFAEGSNVNLNRGPATQFRQVFSLGFGYKFGAEPPEE